MLANYLKIAWRNLIRQKGFSLINICGLAVGIGCCLLIFLYVTDELSYDTYHTKSDRISRIAKHQVADGNEFKSVWSQVPTAPGIPANSQFNFLAIFFAFCEDTVGQNIDLSENADRIISEINDGRFTNIDGLMIWQDSVLIAEHFWNSWNADKPHTLQSVTKSITSLLIGIAIHEGYISDINQKVHDFFPEYKPVANLDEYKKALTIEDLLTMRTGMDWNEHPYEGSNLDQMNSNREDWIRFVLDTPMKEEPGQTYSYNSGGVILLAGIIKSATGMSVQEFAQTYLFGPLEINSAEWWFSDRKGLPHTGGGLNMAAKDMIKIGRLILQKGKWEGRKLLNEKYVDKLFKNRVGDGLRDIQDYKLGYSYLWHVFPVDPNQNFESSDKFIAAWGAEGQWIFILPSHEAVIVFISDTENFRQEMQPLDIIYEHLLGYTKKTTK